MSPMGPTLDGTDWHTKASRRLFMGEAEEKSGFDDSPLFRRQLIDGIANLPGLPHSLEGRGKSNDVGFVYPINPMPAFPAIDVNRRPAGNRVQPWSGISLQVKCIGRPPRLEKGLLGGVLCQRAITEGPQTHAENRPTVLLIKGSDRVGIACGQPLHHADGIHRSTYANRPRFGSSDVEQSDDAFDEVANRTSSAAKRPPDDDNQKHQDDCRRHRPPAVEILLACILKIGMTGHETVQ